MQRGIGVGPLQRAGEIRFIAVTAPKRHNAFPDTLAEPGIKDRCASFGYETFAVTRGQLNAFISAESSNDAVVVRRARISLDCQKAP